MPMIPVATIIGEISIATPCYALPRGVKIFGTLVGPGWCLHTPFCLFVVSLLERERERDGWMDGWLDGHLPRLSDSDDPQSGNSRNRHLLSDRHMCGRR